MREVRYEVRHRGLGACRLGAAGAAAAALLASASAFAQVAPGTLEEGAQESGGLQEIVVTARQRSENIQDTPLSIAAVSGETLEQSGSDTLIDLDAKVPGVQFGNTTTRLQTFTGIRGVGDYSRNPGYDNRAGIYLDGVLMGRSAATDYPIFDIEQVEILRGPQGTLFGKDALTGVISITTVKPQFDDEMNAKLTVGSRSLIAGSAIVNTAVSDTVAVRLALSGRGQRGYYKNKFDDSWVGGGNIFAGRGQLRWLAGDDTTVDLNFDAVRDDTKVLLGGTPLTGPGVPFTDGGRNFSQNHSTDRERKIFGTGLNVEHKLGDYALTSITAYRTSDNRMKFNDFDLSPQEQGSNRFLDKAEAFSQEIRLASPGDQPFNFVVGAFFYDQTATSFWRSTLGPDFPLSVEVLDDTKVGTRILAAFGHATWKPAEWIALDAGLRFNNTRKRIRFDQLVTPNGGAGFISVPNYRDRINESSLNPMLSLTLSPTRDIHLYGTFSTADRPGGWNADIVKTNQIRFEGEDARNYEVGLKSELFDRTLRFNLAAYIMTFRDFQVTQLIRAPGSPTVTPFLTNAGRVRSKGIEADIQAAPFDGFTLNGGVGYNKAIYTAFPDGGGPGIDFTGNTLIEAPRWTASATANYEFAISDGWQANMSATYTYKSKTYADPSNAPRFLQDPFELVNARIGFSREDDAFGVALFANNLFDTKYAVSRFSTALGYNYLAYNEPRVIGLELTIKR